MFLLASLLLSEPFFLVGRVVRVCAGLLPAAGGDQAAADALLVRLQVTALADKGAREMQLRTRHESLVGVEGTQECVE